MTRQAFEVIGAQFVNKRPMRVVAGHAGEPSVAVCSPAAALLKSKRLKAYFPGTGIAPASITSAHVLWQAPQKSTESEGERSAGSMIFSAPRFGSFRSHGCDVGSPRSVARFTSNSRIELSPVRTPLK
jgi:hypothetical protein